MSFRCNAMASRIGEKVPGWVERLLIPALESRVRQIVKEEVGHLEKVMDARFHAVGDRFDSLERRFDARFETLDTKIDSLEKRFPIMQELADIKSRLALVEKNQRPA